MLHALQHGNLRTAIDGGAAAPCVDAEVRRITVPLARADARDRWYQRRCVVEQRRILRSAGNWTAERAVQRAGYWALSQAMAFPGLRTRGRANALNLRFNRLALAFDDLPPAFDDFKILHLSDLHIDSLPEATQAAISLVDGVEADLCVLTGDYQQEARGTRAIVVPMLARLVGTVGARHGVCAVLGNHDDAGLAAVLEGFGVRVLINESWILEAGGERLVITGTDDVHRFHTPDAPAALAAAPAGFRIALVHSAELAGLAATSGHRLYLAGHTHGGQICLPTGRPLHTNLRRHRQCARGLWHIDRMIGYTNTGVGVSDIAARYFSRGEVALISLHRRAATAA